MTAETAALNENDTFEVVKPPGDRQISGGKWVFAVKVGPNGEDTHKARYVAKGFPQIANIDYEETFAPTARMSSVRVLMQKAMQNNMLIHEMDVKTAYLNAPIDHDIYIQQPEGFETCDKNSNELVWKLKKSLYGLKQSGRKWNNTLHTYLVSAKLSQSLADQCVYITVTEANEEISVIVWVDDIGICASNSHILESVKSALSKRFKMKDLGKLSWYLVTFSCILSDFSSS